MIHFLANGFNVYYADVLADIRFLLVFQLIAPKCTLGAPDPPPCSLYRCGVVQSRPRDEANSESDSFREDPEKLSESSSNLWQNEGQTENIVI